jgi:hypothetical protein
MLASAPGLHRSDRASSSGSSTVSLRTFVNGTLQRNVEQYIENSRPAAYDDIVENIVDTLEQSRRYAEENFREEIEEEKLDINQRKDDALHDFSVRTDEMLREKVDQFRDLLDDLFEKKVEDAIDVADANQINLLRARRIEKNIEALWAKTNAGRLDAPEEDTAVRDGVAEGDRKRQYPGLRRRAESV